MKETKTQYRGYIMTSKPILYIVIPCYNEEKVLPETEPLFLQTLRGMISEGKIAEESRVMFVNDGSKDGSEEIAKEYKRKYMKKQGSCSEQYGSGCPVFIVKIKESTCEKISGAGSPQTECVGGHEIRLRRSRCSSEQGISAQSAPSVCQDILRARSRSGPSGRLSGSQQRGNDKTLYDHQQP